MTNLRIPIPIEPQPELLEDGRYRISWNPQSCSLPAFGHYVGTLDQVLALLKKHAPHKPGDEIDCPDCGGRGWIDGKPVTLGDTPLEPCPTCKDGKVTVKSVEVGEEECGDCEYRIAGKGFINRYDINPRTHIPENMRQYPCPKCNGTGKRWWWVIEWKS
jgi:Zn finger protein HypA/HybF involved in hydrogenase expression